MTFYYLRNPDTLSMGLDTMEPTPELLVDIKGVHDSNEPPKKLKCLYRIINLLGSAEQGALEKRLQKVTELIPSGMQFPKVVCARIVIGDQEYSSKRYVYSCWQLIADIIVDAENVGSLEVAYVEMRPDSFKGPFFEEEVSLLNAVASLIGQALYRKKLIDERNKHFKNLESTYQKVLGGYIPICASCKSIRDKKGVLAPAGSLRTKKNRSGF